MPDKDYDMIQIYYDVIQPFLKWAADYQIQTFADVIGDIGFVILVPFIFACTVKYLMKGE